MSLEQRINQSFKRGAFPQVIFYATMTSLDRFFNYKN